MIVLTRAGVCARLAGLGGPAWQCGVVFFTPRRPGPAVEPAGPGRQEDRRGRRIRMAGQNRAACQEAVRALADCRPRRAFRLRPLPETPVGYPRGGRGQREKICDEGTTAAVQDSQRTEPYNWLVVVPHGL